VNQENLGWSFKQPLYLVAVLSHLSGCELAASRGAFKGESGGRTGSKGEVVIRPYDIGKSGWVSF